MAGRAGVDGRDGLGTTIRLVAKTCAVQRQPIRAW